MHGSGLPGSGFRRLTVSVGEAQMKNDLKLVLLAGQPGLLLRLVTDKSHSIGYQVSYAAATARREAQAKTRS